MAILFADGFDHYGTSQIGLKWDGQAGNGASSNAIVQEGRNGKGCFKGNKGWLRKIVARGNNFVVGFAFKGSGGNDGSILSIGDSTGDTELIQLRWHTDGTLQIYRVQDTSVQASTTATYAASTWHYAEFKCQIAASIAASSCVLKVDGAVVATVAAGVQTTWGGTVDANRISAGSVSASLNSFDCWVDDLVIMDTSGSANNDFLGDVTIEALYPAARGNYQGFSAVGSANNYGCVNENPPDGDSTYVASSTVGGRDSYTYTQPGQAIASVKAVQTVLDARKQGSGSRSAAPFFRASGTDHDETGQALTDSYGMLRYVDDTNPATGVAWTAADIAALEAGIKVTA